MSDDEKTPVESGPYAMMTVCDRGVEFRLPIVSKMERLGWEWFLKMRPERKRVFELVCARNKVPLCISRSIFERLWLIE